MARDFPFLILKGDLPNKSFINGLSSLFLCWLNKRAAAATFHKGKANRLEGLSQKEALPYFLIKDKTKLPQELQ